MVIESDKQVLKWVYLIFMMLKPFVHQKYQIFEFTVFQLHPQIQMVIVHQKPRLKIDFTTQITIRFG